MKKFLMFTIFSLFFSFSYGSTSPNLSLKIREFYRAYITNYLDEAKADSVLSKYCTEELKDYVLDIHDEYDFVLDGWLGDAINPESVSVIKQNDRYRVSFKASKYPISNELVTDTLYILVNPENKISYIIRPSDNYTIPNSD